MSWRSYTNDFGWDLALTEEEGGGEASHCHAGVSELTSLFFF